MASSSPSIISLHPSQYITVYPNHGFRFECFEWFQGQRPAEWDPSALTTIALANASGAGGCRDGSFILEGRLLFTLALQVKSQHIVLPLCCDLRNSCCSGWCTKNNGCGVQLLWGRDRIVSWKRREYLGDSLCARIWLPGFYPPCRTPCPSFMHNNYWLIHIRTIAVQSDFDNWNSGISMDNCRFWLLIGWLISVWVRGTILFTKS